MKTLLALILVSVLATPAHAESWRCQYKGRWITTRTRNTDKMDWVLVWEKAGAKWKVVGDYSDKYGRASFDGECDDTKCDFEQSYKTGKLAGKKYYFTGSYTDRALSATSTENTFKGTWGYAKSNRLNGGIWDSIATCKQDTSAKPATLATLETFGVGLTQVEVVKLLGEPASKSPVIEQFADGTFVTEWKWPAKGIEIGMTSRTTNGAFTLYSIMLKSPSTIRTKHGVGIGSSRADVQRAYGEQINGDESDATKIVIGEAHGGAYIALANGKVKSIYVGSAAE